MRDAVGEVMESTRDSIDNTLVMGRRIALFSTIFATAALIARSPRLWRRVRDVNDPYIHECIKKGRIIPGSLVVSPKSPKTLEFVHFPLFRRRLWPFENAHNLAKQGCSFPIRPYGVIIENERLFAEFFTDSNRLVRILPIAVSENNSLVALMRRRRKDWAEHAINNSLAEIDPNPPTTISDKTKQKLDDINNRLERLEEQNHLKSLTVTQRAIYYLKKAYKSRKNSS